MLHSATECNVFINVKQRNEQVRIRRLCYNCLSPRHSTKECPSKYTCKFCSKKHHSSLCYRSSHQVKGTLQPQPSSTLIQKKPNLMTDRPLKPQNHSAHATELLADSAQHHQVEPQSTVRRTDDAATLTCSSNQQIPPITNHSSQASLMCATVSLFNPSEPSKQVNATAFFDSGSSKSYITEELAASLNLSVHTIEDITVSTFGTNDSLYLRCANHTIGIITEKGAKHLEVKSVPTLTGNLQQILVDTQADQEDFTIFTCKPSILIGNDYFWDIVLSDDFHYRLLSKGYRLLHTMAILRNTYVDNVFYGVNTTEEGLKFYNESKELFQTAGMNLRAYASNATKLNHYFEEKEQNKIPEVQKLLGLQWNTTTDDLIVHLPSQPPNNVKWTKRKVLKCVASIYDPLGLVSPLILIAKRLFQSLWKIELSWDDTLPTQQDVLWKQIISSWTVPILSIPRLLFLEDANTESVYDLHVFSDASSSAYCATAYIVKRQGNPPYPTSIIMSKSRLAPFNQSITVPRLELAAMMIGSKLITFITQHLDIHLTRKFLWTDSNVALAWTTNNKNLPVFVRNRVKIIVENTADVILKHIPDNLNAADMGSRGATIQELRPNGGKVHPSSQRTKMSGQTCVLLPNIHSLQPD
ncbi:zinc knuckle [Ancylostoma caninum]|uniref:Zinc knuckle n=1 Tax=Ancylostoma caninum TaxID=29170 RepID=A0A368F8N9_ANCCA|nr:zinc knuckle [Ancylostoma caninum]